jgi:aminoglycoside 6'-N-acetyltransferase
MSACNSFDVLPFECDDLTFRLFDESDAAAFAAYRDNPEVARYQGWTLPFTEDRALYMIRDMATQGGVVNGAWVNVAVTTNSPGEAQIIGDIAVGLNEAGDVAEVGFTITPEFQRKGYATRATRHFMSALQRHGVIKFRASIHPENLASVRVLQKLGFQHVRTDKDAYEDRYGNMVDDAIYESSPCL